MNKPPFDPNQPFQAAADSGKPPFDPSQPFTSGDQAEQPQQGQSPVAAGVQQITSQPDLQPFSGLNPFSMPQGGPVEKLLGSARQIASLPTRFSATMGQASQPVADFAAEKLGEAGVNPYASAAAAMAAGAAVDPRSWLPTGGISVEHPNELPLNVAQVREARTGIPARQFQALYKDPGAIFAGNNVKEAGENIGAAKTAAGINPGITNDVASVTPDNMARINPTKAIKMDDINTVMGKIQNNQQPTPQEAANALKSVNDILSTPSIQNNPDDFRQWTVIKGHINNALGDVAPDVKAANQAFAREKLGEDFSSMHGVNKNGKPSKLGMMAQTGSTAVGALLGHLIPQLNTVEGAAAGAAIGKYGSQAYHAPYIAGLQTAAGSVADKAVNPLLEVLEKIGTSPQAQALFARYFQQKQSAR